MKLILVRHGESMANTGLNYLELGNGLTSKGQEQAKHLHKKLLDEKIDAIFCSPTDRCRETLEKIIKGRNDDQPIHFSKLLGPRYKKETIKELEKKDQNFY